MSRNRLFSILIIFALLAFTGCGQKKSEEIAYSLNDDVLQYRNMSYGEFVKKTGQTAEPYHADRFVAGLIDKDYQIVFDGGFDYDKMEATISDDDKCLRLQGKLRDFVKMNAESDISVDELAASLNAISFEYREGAGTIYYVSDNYVTLKIDSDNDGIADIFLDIAATADGKNAVKPDAAVFLYWDMDTVIARLLGD